jgi:hypothetical protein
MIEQLPGIMIALAIAFSTLWWVKFVEDGSKARKLRRS